MKTIKFLTITIISIILFNCKSDDEGNNNLPAENTAQPTVINVERINFSGLPSSTYTLTYNNEGQLISVVNSEPFLRVNHDIFYENNRISNIVYNAPGGARTTTFTYDLEGKISNVTEEGAEARNFSSFEYNDDDNSYILSLIDLLPYTISVALDSNNHILWYNGRLLTLNNTQTGLFKPSIGDLTPLYFVLSNNAIHDLYYFSQHEIIRFDDIYIFSGYERNQQGDITIFESGLIGTDAYINYTIDY